MSNVNAPFGARVIKNLLQGADSCKVSHYFVEDSDVLVLRKGDFLKLVQGSGVYRNNSYYQIVTKADVGDTIVGVANSFGVNPLDLNTNYRKASTDSFVEVYDDPYVLFEIQTNGTASYTDFGKYADIEYTAGSDIFGTSGMVIDQATVSPSSGQVRILKASNAKNNEIGAYTIFLCLINEHSYK